MEKFINTKKEQFLGFDFLKNHTLPSRDVFDYRVHKKEYSEYFAQYGFQVSMVYADFYSRMWCSDYNDRYMSDDVYYYYVIPCLNRFDFINSYMDKNGYDRLFPDIKKPSILMKNINGRFFSPDDMPISTEEAVKLVLATDLDCIIKPSIDSGSGKNVKLVRKEEIDTAKVKDLFETYKWDFNIQKRLEQSATLKKLNESSLNTLRIYTYRTLAGEYVLLVSVVRFGGKGAFNDNASTGGGFCHVYDDGSLFGTNSQLNGVFLNEDEQWRIDLTKKQQKLLKLEFKTSGEGKSIEKYISDDVSPAAITNSKNQVFLERVLEKVHKAKEVADIVVAYPHVGGQYNPSPGFYTRFIIDSLKEAGADIIVANHPHTSLRCERLDNGVFCAYALGNLAFTPDVGFFLDNVLAEFGIVLHSYWDESTKRLIKLTFNVTRCMIGEDGITRVVEVSELYNRLTNKSERERLMIDNESVVNRFAGWAKSFEPYKEYVIF